MKKLLALLLAAVIVLSFTACGGEDNPGNTEQTEDTEMPRVPVEL